MELNRKDRLVGIDYTLANRFEVLRVLEEILQTPEMGAIEVTKRFDRLIALKLDLDSMLVELLRKTTDLLMVELICNLVSYSKNIKMDQVLVEVFIDENIAREIKFRLLPLLVSYGIDPHDEEAEWVFEQAFGSPQIAIGHIVEETLAAITDDDLIGNIGKMTMFFLDSYWEFDPEQKLNFVHDMGKSRDERSIKLLLPIALSGEPEISALLIDYLGQMKSPLALSALIEIEKNIFSIELSRKAERVARRLKFMGLEPAAKSEETGVVALKPYKVMLSSIGDDGESNLVMFALHVEETSLLLLSFAVGNHVGIMASAHTTEITASEVALIFGKIQSEMPVRELELRSGLEILQSGLISNRESGSPIPPLFFACRELLGLAQVLSGI